MADRMTPYRYASVRDQARLLAHHGKWAEARRLVKNALSRIPPSARKRRAELLDILVNAECGAARWSAALTAITQRRVLPFREPDHALDLTFDAAFAQLRLGNPCEALHELTQLIRAPSFGHWSMKLRALGLYAEAQTQCAQSMDPLLKQHLSAAVQELQIPSSPQGSMDLNQAIIRANTIYREASMRYQELLLKCFDAVEAGQSASAEEYLLSYLQTENVGSFLSLAETMHRDLCARRERTQANPGHR